MYVFVHQYIRDGKRAQYAACLSGDVKEAPNRFTAVPGGPADVYDKSPDVGGNGIWWGASQRYSVEDAQALLACATGTGAWYVAHDGNGNVLHGPDGRPMHNFESIPIPAGIDFDACAEAIGLVSAPPE